MTEKIGLYTNAKGTLVTHGSYSARETFRFCPRKFKLGRIDGYKGIEERASALFGKCTESAMQWFEECGRTPGAGVEKFTVLWQQVAALPDAAALTYTDCEGDWTSLLRAGREMQMLYDVRAPN